MATPVVRSAASGQSAFASSVSATLAASTQIGDTVVLIHSNDFGTLADMLTPTSSAGVSNWTLVAQADGGSGNFAHIKVWVGRVTTPGVQTVSANQSIQSGTQVAALVIAEEAIVDVAAGAFSNTPSSLIVAPSVSPTMPGGLLICAWATTTGNGSFTPPGGMTEWVDSFPSASLARAVATENLVNAGPTGTRIAIFSTTAARQAGVSVVLRPLAEPVDVADSGAGADSIALFRARFLDVEDSGAATDDIGVVEDPFVDQATAAESIALGSSLSVSDGGSGHEFVAVREIPRTQVLPPQPITVYDVIVVARIPQPSGPPAFLEVDPIPWRRVEITNALNKPQDLLVTCHVTRLTEGVLQRLRTPHALATELWVTRDGTPIFAGPLQGWQVQGETLSLRAKGLLQYLRMMVIDSDKRFDQVDQFEMAKWMVDQWQELEYGHFGIDTGAVGQSGVLRDGTYLRHELHNVLQRIEDLSARRNGFDFEVDPASRQLLLWYPTKGVDRSTGEDAIVFDRRNITSRDMLCSIAPEDVASEGYGSSVSAGADEPLLSVQANPELRATYGRVAITGTWHDISEQGTLDDHVRGMLDVRNQAVLMPGPRVRVTPDADLNAYGVGDTVYYDLPEPLGVSGAYRIYSRRLVVEQDGHEMVDIEFV